MSTITLYTGPMWSGKSAKLIESIELHVAAGRPVLVARPTVDTRTSRLEIASRVGTSWEAINTDPGGLLAASADIKPEVVAVDELHLWPSGIIHALFSLRLRGIHVLAAGLDLDAFRDPFVSVAHLEMFADHVRRLFARCSHCNAPAEYSSALVPMTTRIKPGDGESYEPRCEVCWTPPPEG